MNECEHKNLKYFKKTDKVVCLDCGEDFYKEVIYPVTPTMPHTPPEPRPDWVVYPNVTWSKCEN